MKYHVVINTYERPKECAATLEMVMREMDGKDYTVTIIDDASKSDYSAIEFVCNNVLKGRYYRNSQNNGRKGHWRNINTGLQDVYNSGADYMIWIPDDMEYKEGWIDNALHVMTKNGYPVLNCYLDHRVNVLCWGNVPVKRADGVYSPGFIDGCGILSKKALQALKYRVEPIDTVQWERFPNSGSRVGAQLTRRLTKLGIRIGIIGSQIILHDWSIEKSKMNPQDNVKHRRV